MLNNGGTNLAGGIGLFTGSDGYKVQHNAICGNFSAEYGGAMTAFGYMSNPGGTNGGTIAGNTIWFNSSYDEGGAVMLAGELPATPTGLSPGTGAATIDSNVIDANLASDDGGGIRLLQVSGTHVTKADPQTITITNNTITNNVSAHEGGGIALDDAPFVNIVDNTVAGNLTTATAVTSDGQPAPAGLATGPNSDPLMARLVSSGSLTAFSLIRTTGQSTFSKPVLLDNVFNDNRAGTFVGGYVYGIGGTLPNGMDNSVDPWDMGVVGDPGLLHPVSSVLQTTTGTDGGVNVTFTDTAGFKDPSPELTVRCSPRGPTRPSGKPPSSRRCCRPGCARTTTSRARARQRTAAVQRARRRPWAPRRCSASPSRGTSRSAPRRATSTTSSDRP